MPISTHMPELPANFIDILMSMSDAAKNAVISMLQGSINQCSVSPKAVKSQNELPSKRLKGVFKMPSDFDYKNELYKSLKDKYDL